MVNAASVIIESLMFIESIITALFFPRVVLLLFIVSSCYKPGLLGEIDNAFIAGTFLGLALRDVLEAIGIGKINIVEEKLAGLYKNAKEKTNGGDTD